MLSQEACVSISVMTDDAAVIKTCHFAPCIAARHVNNPTKTTDSTRSDALCPPTHNSESPPQLMQTNLVLLTLGGPYIYVGPWWGFPIRGGPGGSRCRHGSGIRWVDIKGLVWITAEWPDCMLDPCLPPGRTLGLSGTYVSGCNRVGVLLPPPAPSIQPPPPGV